jgi:hypothetical protein
MVADPGDELPAAPATVAAMPPPSNAPMINESLMSFNLYLLYMELVASTIPC